MLGDPFHQLAAIGAIDPDQPQLFAGSTKPGTQEPSACGVGDRGGSDDHSHEPPQGSDQQMPFTAFDFFAAIVATLSTQFCGLDTLAVQSPRGGMLVTACLLAPLGAPGVMHPLPVTTITP